MKREKISRNHGLFKRVLSFVLAFAMIVTMGSFSSLGSLVVQAAQTSYKLYFELPEGTEVTDWAVNAWEASALTVEGDAENAFRPTTWGDGPVFPALLKDEALEGWGYVTITGTISGLQFIDANGKEYKCWNNQIAAQEVSTAYYSTTANAWYKDAAKTEEIKEAEIRNIFALVGDGLGGCSWDLGAISEDCIFKQDAENENLYTLTIKNAAKKAYLYKVLQDPENKQWDLPWQTYDGNRTLKLDAESDVTLTLDVTDAQKNITVDVVPVEKDPSEGEEEPKDDTMIFVVAGEEALTGKSWSATAVDNEKNVFVRSEENKNIYSITYTELKKGTYKYKILEDPDTNGWAASWAGESDSVLSLSSKSNVTISIDVTDETHGVKVDITPIEEPAYEPDSSMYVLDRVQLEVADQLVDMEIYNKGIYETSLTLPAGEYTANLLVAGVKTDTNTLTVAEEGVVVFRADENKLKNSVTDKILHTAAIVGDFTGIEFENPIANWNPAEANAELNYLGGGLYMGTFNFAALTSDTAIQYKVAFDDSWDYSIGQNGGNIALTIPSGTTSLTIVADEANQIVYDSIHYQDFTIVQSGNSSVPGNAYKTTVSLIGTARESTDANWSPGAKGYEFHKVSDKLYAYSKVFEEAGTYAYKVVFDYSKWYEKESGDQTLKTTEEQTAVVFVYDSESGYVYDSLNDEEEVAKLLGMSIVAKTSEVITNENGSVKFQLATEANQKVELHYALSAENLTFESAPMNEAKNGIYVSEDLDLGDAALNIVYYYTVGENVVLDGLHDIQIGDATYSLYEKAAFTGKNVFVPGTFPGKSWDAGSNKMVYLGDQLYAHTFEAVGGGNYEFKIAFDGSWAENYGVNGNPGGDNYKVTVPSTQDVIVYYSDATHLAATSLNYKFVTVNVEGTNVPVTALKDPGLTGIYEAKILLEEGTYSDVCLKVSGEEKAIAFEEFTLTKAKEVTFYYAPEYGIAYHNAFAATFDKNKVKFDSKDGSYKSVYGAVAQNEKVTFAIDTDKKITKTELVVKANDTKVYSLTKAENGDAAYRWSTEVSFEEIGEYQYFFVLYEGGAISIYSDDDGYYGTGKVTTLTEMVPYDLVVYKEGFTTPDWMKNAVIYQIFPDRFFDGDSTNNTAQLMARGDSYYEYVNDWYVLPENPEQEELLTKEEYLATGAHYGDRIWNNEIYGGDLKGIVQKIDYLKALGVNVIYLNPVFASISSHRYDTSDYAKIDPILGTEGDFAELVKVAEENGMKIVLDGVFNHVSDDSIYFDRYYKYLEAGTKTIGAYPFWAYVYDYMAENSEVEQEAAVVAAREYFAENYGIEDFSYTEWFDVFTTYLTDDNGETVTDEIGLRAGKPVYGYDGWWGYDNMPIIKSTNGSEYQTGNWSTEIISGEDSIAQYWITKGSNGWRLDVANEISDETWQRFRESVKSLDQDAVIIGEIWDDATEYLMGDMYDSVMNYVFRGAVLSYAKGGSAKDTAATLEKIRERYPSEAFYAMMNLVASHDTTRLLSYLDGIDDDRNQKDVDSAFPTYENTSDAAKLSQYLVAFLQFTYPGAPTIYYGDEIGMTGADDPDDRRGFTWGKGNKEIVTWYAKLAAIRNNYPVLRTGNIFMMDFEDEAILGFVRTNESQAAVVLANNKGEDVELTFSSGVLSAGNWVDLISGKTIEVQDETATVTVPARLGMILVKESDEKEITVNEDALKSAYEDDGVVGTRQKYQITYHYNGVPGKSENPTVYTKDTPTFKLFTPRALVGGYYFGGWYKEATLKTKVTEIKKGTKGDLNLYAKWIPYTYKVVFHNGEETQTVSQTMTYGTEAALKANTFTSQAGGFIGWATSNEEGAPVVYTNKQKVKNLCTPYANGQTVDLYAVWQTGFDINYANVEDAEIKDAVEIHTFGKATTLPKTVTREGYTFAGWYKEAALKNKITSISKTTAADVTVYAKWKPNTYKIKFNKNGATSGKMSDQTFTYDKDAKLRTNAFQKKGYEFVGWKVGETDTVLTNQQVIGKDNNLATSGTVTLHAVWEKAEYTITYELCGGMIDGSTDNVTATYEYVSDKDKTPIALLDGVTRDGFTFAGWYTTKNKEAKLTNASYGDVTFHAVWKATDKFVVKYNGNGNTNETASMADKEYTYGKNATLSDKKFVKDGYVFLGWSTDPDATTATYKNKAALTKTVQDQILVFDPETKKLTVTLYAVWANQFEVKLDAAGGAFEISEESLVSQKEDGSYAVTYTYKQGLTAEQVKTMVPVKDGYTFGGWYVGSKKATSVSASQSGNLVWKAKWTANKYNVTFAINDPTGKSTKTVVQKNVTFGKATALTKNKFAVSGYKFLGWNVDPMAEEVMYTNGQKVTAINGSYSEKVTLYAIWEKQTYTIKYVNVTEEEIDENQMTLSYTVDDSVALTTPERLGYSFVGWYTDKKCTKKASNIKEGTTGNKTFYAKWAK